MPVSSLALRRALTNAASVTAAVYAVYTCCLIGRMLWFVSYSMTSALHVDSIIMMEELHLFHEGKYGLGYLWAPYWGNRTLVPRLLMMLD